MRRKSILAALIFVLLFTACAAVGCGEDDPPSYADEAIFTVTFYDGETLLKTVSVARGEELKAEDISAPPAKSGFEFTGWFREDSEISAGFVPSEDIAAYARYAAVYMVTFRVGDRTVKTVTVREGERIADSEFPAAEEENYVCEGWTAEGEAFTAQTPVACDTVVCAVLKRIWKVSFSYGETTVGELSVKDGESVAEERMPQLSLSESYRFEGWFVNGVPLSQYSVTKNVTANARVSRVYKIVFVSGQETLSTVFVREGETLTASQIPQSPNRSEYAFEGWYVGETPVENLPVTENLIAEAKYTHVYTVTFRIDETHSQTLTVRAGERVDSQLFPSVPQANGAFLGWYTQANQNLLDLAVTQNLTVFPLFIREENYDGVWICEETEKELLIVIDVQKGTLTVGEEVVDRPYSFEENSGKLTYTESGVASYSMLVSGNNLSLTKRDFEDGGIFLTALEKEDTASPVSIAGIYRKDDTELIVSEGGYVLSYRVAVRFGKVTESGVGYRIDYKATVDSNFRTVTATTDGFGNLTLKGGVSAAYNGLFIKNAESASVYRCDSDTFTVYAIADGIVCVYFSDAVYSIVTPSFSPSVGQTVTFLVSDEPIEILITEEGAFEYV